SAAEIHGVDMAEQSTRRLVLMGVLSGERGTEIIAKAMGKQGMQWNAVLSGGGAFLPSLVSRQLSRYVRRRVVARTGQLWMMRLLQFGLGLVLCGLGARGGGYCVVDAMLEIFVNGVVLVGVLAAGRGALEG